MAKPLKWGVVTVGKRVSGKGRKNIHHRYLCNVKQRLVLFLKVALFWLTFAWFARIWFVIYQWDNLADPGFGSVLAIFRHGFMLDLSFVGYIMALSGLLFTFTYALKGRWLWRLLFPVSSLLLLFLSMILVSDAELYSHWGYRMDATPMLYLANPQEAFASVEIWRTVLLSATMLVIVSAFIFLFGKIFRKHIIALVPGKVYGTAVFLVITGSMIIPVRGGLGIAPINSGNAYFSAHQFSNHAAVNVFWNVGHALSKLDKTTRQYHFIDDAKADRIFQTLHITDSTSTQLVNYKENPNVVIIILESFTSKIIEPLGGIAGVTPELNKLTTQGQLFTHFFANADRSDKGIVAILSSFPAHPTNSIIKYPEKTAKLPSLTRVFNKNGYESTFYYGGDIDFANMRSYILNSGFQDVVSLSDFPSKLNDSKWGVHDEHVFDSLATDINRAENPFFKVYFTLSSHDPFEVPMDTKIEGTDRAHKFMNSAYYTDKCLGAFFDKMKASPKWENTIFILVADHGSPRPGKSKVFEPEKYKIPMLWLGGGVAPGKVGKYGSQMDIAPTLLSQLNLKNNYQSHFGQNLLTRKSPFAFYTYNDGFSFLTEHGIIIYDNKQQGCIRGNNAELEDLGKVVLQKISAHFAK